MRQAGVLSVHSLRMLCSSSPLLQESFLWQSVFISMCNSTGVDYCGNALLKQLHSLDVDAGKVAI